MIYNKEGIYNKDALNQLIKKGTKSNLNMLLERATIYKNKIFIDCSSSKQLIKQYHKIINFGFSIVAANKLANTQSMKFYKSIRNSCFENGVFFKYETNVGAGLPVISTIKSLLYSGDKINKIQGVLSGTLSYLFNNFDGKLPFSKLVWYAKKNGYTEPNPQEDLLGIDVARKCLILGREIGYNLELNQIRLESLLPNKKNHYNGSSDFYKYLASLDKQFFKKMLKTKKAKKKLCYMCTIEKDNIIVSLESIQNDHPFYHLKGSENIVSISTNRYYDQPIVIKGPAAGAAIAAGGVVADIIGITNYKT